MIITKYLHESEPLLTDFTDLVEPEEVEKMAAQAADIPYPFRFQIFSNQNRRKKGEWCAPNF